MVRVTSTAWTYLAVLGLVATQQSQQVAAQHFKCHGINYNVRAGPDWAPDATKCKSSATIASELAKLKTVTDTIRLYSLTDCSQGLNVVPAAVKAGLKVSLGLWVGSEASSFEAEKAKFVEMLAQDGLVNAKDIVGIHVGSEAVYHGDVNTTVAIANYKEIKALVTAKNLDIPMTIADIGDIYLQYSELVDAVDFVSANAFPFWEKKEAKTAVSYMYSRLEPLIENAASQNKEVIIGETGWATGGINANASDATPANAALFFHDFYTLAQQKSLKYFYFAGFDEQWKIATLDANNTVEAYFGLFKENGDLKDEYAALTFDASSSSSSSSSGDVGVGGSMASSSSVDGSQVVPATGDASTTTSSSDVGSSAASTAESAAAGSVVPGTSGDDESGSGGSGTTNSDDSTGVTSTTTTGGSDAYPADSTSGVSTSTSTTGTDSASTVHAATGDDSSTNDSTTTASGDDNSSNAYSTDGSTATTGSSPSMATQSDSASAAASATTASGDDNSSNAYSTDDSTATTGSSPSMATQSDSASAAASATKSPKRKDCDA